MSVSGALVKADAPMQVELKMSVDGEAGLYSTEHNFFRAPLIAIHPARSGDCAEGDSPSHTVWAIFGNTIVEGYVPETMVTQLMDVRDRKGLPYFFSYDKPFTMPNGEH